MLRSTSKHRRQAPPRILPKVVAAVVIVVVLAVGFVAVQLLRTPPVASAAVTGTASAVAGGPSAAIPWPSAGEAAMSVQGVGSFGGVRENRAVPLASVTKLVAAMVVLRDHPLQPGQSGPSLTVTPADVTAYRADLRSHDSVLQVAAGEKLTEYQALEGMLIPSGDNVAAIVAAWDAPNEAVFVSRMNAEAKRLGLTHTHLADASGLDPDSAGSAADMVTLADAVLAQPVLRAIVGMPQVTLPVAGTVYNFDYDVGHDGIFGVKTGSTTQAGGNFVFAAHKTVGGHQLTVVGAVLGQGGRQPLPAALAVAERLVNAAASAVVTRTVLPAGLPLVTVRVPWGGTVVGRTTSSVSALSLPGERFPVTVEEAPVMRQPDLRSLRSGERLATVVVHIGHRAVDVPVVAGGGFSPPSLSYLLSRS